MIRGLLDKAKDCVLDISISNLDSQSYQSQDAATTLRNREKHKRHDYEEACHYHRRDFKPFVVSADGLLGNNATEILQLLASKLATKWNRPYSPVMCYINARISIALIRASHLCLRGSRRSSTAGSLLHTDADSTGTFHLLHS